MGNTCGCCATEEMKIKDNALDEYIKKNHVLKFPHKCPKVAKLELNQQFKAKQNNLERYSKCQVNLEILDEVSRR